MHPWRYISHSAFPWCNSEARTAEPGTVVILGVSYLMSVEKNLAFVMANRSVSLLLGEQRQTSCGYREAKPVMFRRKLTLRITCDVCRRQESNLVYHLRMKTTAVKARCSPVTYIT